MYHMVCVYHMHEWIKMEPFWTQAFCIISNNTSFNVMLELKKKNILFKTMYLTDSR